MRVGTPLYSCRHTHITTTTNTYVYSRMHVHTQAISHASMQRETDLAQAQAKAARRSLSAYEAGMQERIQGAVKVQVRDRVQEREFLCQQR